MNTPQFNIQLWDIDKVKPYELNSKLHDPSQVKKIAQSIREFGWDQPIVIDKDGVIIKGHGRRLAAIELGAKQVPVWVRDDLTEEQVRASRLADNRVALSGQDNELLRKELASLDFDLAGIFDKKELDFVLADMAELDTGAFVEDLDHAVQIQSDNIANSISTVKSKDVAIAKVLGFKSVKASDERYLAAFLATIEESTGLTGADALVKHAQQVLEAA